MGIHSSAENVALENVRQSVTYHPSVWGDYFLTPASNHEESSTSEGEELQESRQEVEKLLGATHDDSLQKLELIDAIQRLGVDHHFQKEIEKSLQDIYLRCCNDKDDYDHNQTDLHTVALRFRLLRQQGYNISSETFNKFTDRNGKFEESLADDVRGMLSLYEAAHCGVQGEKILDEALVFSSSNLKSILAKNHMSNSGLTARIEEAFDTPIRKCLTNFGARKFMSMYEEDESHSEALLKFARLDFNFSQKLHQKEISDLTRWWKELDFKTKLPFARDRMVECYCWTLGIHPEPQYNLARNFLSKVIMLASVIDDIYDVRGTLDELQLFTDAIQRWDISAMEQLPPYMRVCYEALLNVYAEVEELERIDGPYRVHYAKEEMKKLARAYLEESQWLYKKYIPTFKEYMSVAIPSSGYIMVAGNCLVGLGNSLVMKDFDWVSCEPLMVKASAIIARLMDDMAGHGFEKKISAVECYTNENGASEKEAFEELEKQVSNAWKDMNQEFLHPTAVSMTVLTRVLNAARVIHLLYKDGDSYTNSKTYIKELIEAVLIQPVKI
uniref:Beta-caryophyllene synthase n=1 Tax=Phyla dulcis TaxID=542674 RepID=TPS6_PHYDL|nr:RecName: Full=Beta-caryophyllene synthase; AltName: Full=Terpene synthase 6; Short=LdTPS6 [Phyla dulcis]AFR23370.1 beta-caryophyllene synthase [Phyla dulcis]